VATEEQREEYRKLHRRLYGREADPCCVDSRAEAIAAGREFKDETSEEKTLRLTKAARDQGLPERSFLPDWTKRCVNCGATPVLPITGMCGPCNFGEAETINGNW